MGKSFCLELFEMKIAPQGEFVNVGINNRQKKRKLSIPGLARLKRRSTLIFSGN